MGRHKSSELIINNPRPPVEPRTCPNCGELLAGRHGHFVPPSFGDEGFWICPAGVSNG